MNINLIRLGGVVRALNRIGAAIERHNDLTEIAMNAEGLTTRIVTASKSDLADTRVEYPDPDFENIVAELEDRGHKVTEEDRERIYVELEKLDTENLE